MDQNSLIKQYLEKLKQNKTPEELAKYLDGLMKFQAAELYLTMADQLNDEDVAAIEAIENEDLAQQELKKRFTMRSGMTPEDFINKIRDVIAQNYITPADTSNISAD